MMISPLMAVVVMVGGIMILRSSDMIVATIGDSEGGKLKGHLALVGAAEALLDIETGVLSGRAVPNEGPRLNNGTESEKSNH